MTEASKINPAPLDAYETAKPDEPIFTLQGGDPLSAPLVRQWAYLARIRAGQPSNQSWINDLLFVAQSTNVAHDPDACRNLLIRATEAEQVSWHMDGYRRGEMELAKEIRTNELDRLDIYDTRRRAASFISNFISEFNDFLEKLREYKFVSEELDNITAEAFALLISIHAEIEIRRGNS